MRFPKEFEDSDLTPAEIKRILSERESKPKRAPRGRKHDKKRPSLSPPGTFRGEDGTSYRGGVGALSSLADSGKKYSTILADPPWPYTNQGTRGRTDGEYLTLGMDDIREMPVPALCEEQAHLHLWTTSPFLQASFSVMEAWGFTYKSSFVWVKPQMGIGNYWRLSHEFLLLGVKGKAIPAGSLTFDDKSLMSWISHNRTKHSSKPEIVREFIERSWHGPYIELFARTRRSGWDAWGNEVEA